MIENNLDFFMKRERFTNRELAKQLNIYESTLYNIRKNRTKGIDYEFWDKAHKILKLKPNEQLFKYVPDKKGD